MSLLLGRNKSQFHRGRQPAFGCVCQKINAYVIMLSCEHLSTTTDYERTTRSLSHAILCTRLCMCQPTSLWVGHGIARWCSTRTHGVTSSSISSGNLRRILTQCTTYPHADVSQNMRGVTSVLCDECSQIHCIPFFPLS